MKWVVFSNVYVALCGAALTAASYALFGVTPRLDVVAILVFCCTLVIYNLDRLVEPHPGDSVHERWVASRRRPLWALTCTAALGAGVCTLWLTPAARWSLVPAGMVALGYCIPIVKRRRGVDGPNAGAYRLKELPGAKLVLIALVWTYATALLPMLQAGITLDPQSLGVLTGRLLFIAAVALPFDLPELPIPFPTRSA